MKKLRIKSMISLALLLVIITAAALPMFVYAEGSLKINASTLTCAHGDIVNVVVNISENPGVWSIGIEVDFDTALLELTAVTEGADFDDGMILNTDSYNSPYPLNWNNSALSDATYDGTFATLSFKVKNNAQASKADITLRHLRNSPRNTVNFAGNTVAIEFTHGKITINHDMDGTPTNDDVDANCLPGKAWWACSVCGYEDFDVIDATGQHTPAYEYIDGTETHKKYCSVCGEDLAEPENCTLEYENNIGVASHKKYCSVCNNVFDESEDCDKDYNLGGNDEPATCVEEGKDRWQCKKCGYEGHDVIDIDPDAHDIQYVQGTPGKHKPVCMRTGCNYEGDEEDCTKEVDQSKSTEPKCNKDGEWVYFPCPECGYDFPDETNYNRLPHSYGNWVYSDTAYHERQCSVCHSIEQDFHDNIVETRDEATCTATGSITYKTCVCGYQREPNIIDMLPHDFTDQPLITDVEPTHTENGSGHYECKYGCGTHSDPVVINKPEGGHDFSKAISNGDGTHKMVCSIAGCTAEDPNNTAVPCSKEVDTVNSTAPKCNEDGEWKYLPCTCGYVFDPEPNQNRPPHSYGDWYELDSVSHERECAVCGDKQQEDHDFDGQVIPDVEPTHIANGSGHYECKVCGAHSDPVPIDMIGDHEFTKAVSNNDGTHKMVCSIDGCTAEDPNKTAVPCSKIIDTVNSTEPSCNTPGEWVYLPCVCGYVFDPEPRSATGEHNFVATILDDTDPDYETMHDMRCGCGASNGKKPHTFGAYQWIIYPTEFTDGLKVRTCTACGFVNGVPVPAGTLPATITFRTNGGTAVKAYEGYTSEIIDLTQYKPFKRGSYFAGWFTDPALTVPADIMFVLEGDVILYAKYGALSGSVTYFPFPILPVNPNFSNLYFQTNGGLAIDPITLSTGTTINLWQYIPVRPGYSFEGWYRDAELTRRITQVQVIDPNTVVYAKWSLIG